MACRRFETTLFDLVSELSDTLRDDQQTVRVVAQLILDGRVRTREGHEVLLASSQLPDARADHRSPPRSMPAAGGLRR